MLFFSFPACEHETRVLCVYIGIFLCLQIMCESSRAAVCTTGLSTWTRPGICSMWAPCKYFMWPVYGRFTSLCSHAWFSNRGLFSRQIYFLLVFTLYHFRFIIFLSVSVCLSFQRTVSSCVFCLDGLCKWCHSLVIRPAYFCAFTLLQPSASCCSSSSYS